MTEQKVTRLQQLLDGQFRIASQSIADGISTHHWGKLTDKDAKYVDELRRAAQALANGMYQLEQELRDNALRNNRRLQFVLGEAEHD